jgi:hypothetical protein
MTMTVLEEVKAEVYKDGELVGETTLLREPHIELHWKMIDSELGFMERMVLPTGGEILFNHEEGKSDFEPLKEYIGTVCDYYRNDEYTWSKKLEGVRPTEDGINALWFEPIETPPEGGDIEGDVQMNGEEEGA